MIITAAHARSLVKSGKATPTTTVTDDQGRVWQALDRHDIQRVDHYRVGSKQGRLLRIVADLAEGRI